MLAEKCPNLTHLNLSGNKIKDLSTIEPLVSHPVPGSMRAGAGAGLVPGNVCVFISWAPVMCCELGWGLLEKRGPRQVHSLTGSHGHSGQAGGVGVGGGPWPSFLASALPL